MGKVKYRDILLIVIVILLPLVGAYIGHTMSEAKHEKELYDTTLDSEELREKLAVVKTQKTSLKTALKETLTDNDSLRDTIAGLKARPAQIEYITQIETIIEVKETEVIVATLPENHQFTLQENLVVGEFAAREDSYRFSTYRMYLKGNLVLGESSSALLLEAATEYEPSHWEEVPVRLTVKRIQEHKVFEPHISIGVALLAPPFSAQPIFGVSFIHPTPVWDVGLIHLGYNGESASLGIDPVTWNLGSKVPILTDSWIGAGVNLSTDATWQGSLSLTTKF